ncbi:MAG: RDD family protein [Oscillospiraceae bacterium]
MLDRVISHYDPMTGQPIYTEPAADCPVSPTHSDDAPTLGSMLDTLMLLSPGLLDDDAKPTQPDAPASPEECFASPFAGGSAAFAVPCPVYSASANLNPDGDSGDEGDVVPAADCAGFFTRLFAFCIDSLIAWIMSLVVTGVVGLALSGLSGDVMNSYVLFEITLKSIVQYLVISCYFIVLTGTTGMTAGKRLLRIRVVCKDGSRPNWWTVIYRETIGRYLSSILFIGYLVLAFDGKHRGFHDMLSDTRVVLCK